MEAIARTYVGIALWLELGADNTKEGILRKKYIIIARNGLKVLADSTKNDYCDFSTKYGSQSLVEAAFLSQALLTAKTQLWQPLDAVTKKRIISNLKKSRTINPHNNNWLLFSAMVETFIYSVEGHCEMAVVENAVNKHNQWFKGDGMYGDGEEFHYDYYNSLVMHPLLLEILSRYEKDSFALSISYKTEFARAQRYTEILERLIAPDGTYPPVGRSLAYRAGVFNLLCKMTLNKTLPKKIHPAQVRSALSEVIHRQLESKSTFTPNGWLTIGLYGHQPGIGEEYISTGSTYYCSTVFQVLGLPATDPFWKNISEDWTSKKIWNGENAPADHALREKKK